MSNTNDQPVSLSEFARRMDCSEATVRHYVQKGKIHGPAVAYKPNGKVAGLYFDLAQPQYATARALVKHRFARSGGPPTGKKAVGSVPTPTRAASAPRPAAGKISELSEDELSELDLSELAKLEIILRIQAKQIELGKLSASLLPIDKVRANLGLFAAECRKRLEAVPARVIDSIMSAPTRAAGLAILTREINEYLIGISSYDGK